MKRLLSLSLLGSFQVKLDEEPVTRFEYDKVRALLAFLAVERPVPHRRDALTGLLWPEQPDRAARHSLSQALLTLRQALGDPDAAAPFVLADRTTVRLDPEADFRLDVTDFEAHLAATAAHEHPRPETCSPCMERRRRAVALYQGDFLKGLAVGDSPTFEEWVTLERERLHRLALDALFALTQYHEWRGELEQARAYAWRQVELEPWREEAHQQLMRVLAHNGQRSAALAQYESCRRILAEELGAEPSAATTRLYERILAADAARSRRPPLPPQPTPFVGRQAEVAATASLLANPDCRALTILGPGGMGKTRLALQVAEKIANRFLDGVHFIPLTGLETADLLLTTLADAFDFSFYGDDDPRAQLLDYLRRKELLLVLDSFEHLPDAVGLVAEVLQVAPEVKVLITSRARLNLSWEWVFELEGLAAPDETVLDRERGLASYSAVQLFVQSAERIRPQFSLAPADEAALARICRLVAGVPLALELAATWVRVLSPAEIAAEIERGLGFLVTTSPDVPARHRSMRAVFEYSWQLLSPGEQEAFRRLSVFRAGFARDAAEQVAEAPLAVLAALVDKSLLSRRPAGRYELHELLRQFGAERRDEVPGEKERLLDRHARYYAALLERQLGALRGGDQAEALAEIDREIENVRLAWRRLVAQADTAGLERCLDALFLFYDLRSWATEGEEAFRLAVERLERVEPAEATDLLLARARARQGKFLSRLSEFDRARHLWQQSIPVFQGLDARRELALALRHLAEVDAEMGAYEAAEGALQESLALLQALDDKKETAATLNRLGAVIHNRGEYRGAKQYYEESLEMFRAAGDRRGIAASLHTLGHVAYELGEYREAARRYQDSLVIKRELGDAWGLTNSLNNLGIVYFVLGEYAQAEACYQESLAVRRELGSRWGMAATLNNLGLIAFSRQAYAEAEERYREVLAICREIGDQSGVATALSNFGEVAFARGAFDEAKQYYLEGLDLFREIGHAAGITFALGYLGEVSVALEAYGEAREYYYEALAVALETQAAPRALDSLAGVAALLIREAQVEPALDLLDLAIRHPASERATQEKAQRLLEGLTSGQPAESGEGRAERAAASEWEPVVKALLANWPGRKR